MAIAERSKSKGGGGLLREGDVKGSKVVGRWVVGSWEERCLWGFAYCYAGSD